ncbi:hypothetical protein [Romboutsia lituseburensis]|uniref:hypothetical protein n=1 Tax=Romboutsia lituseburensis TaxID=1537 RepID=UPI00215AF741|nr:hypothetical protein [Romboutsia lituseburensis]MCR8745230.1 hypothetical protein [Romboutsia lituseburensis]
MSNYLSNLTVGQLEKFIEDAKGILREQRENRPDLKLILDTEKTYTKRIINLVMDGLEYRIFITNNNVTSIWIECKHVDEYGIQRGYKKMNTTSIKKVFGMSKADFFDYIENEAEYIEEEI